MSIAFLIAGLGNPGPKYLRTRHNIGFMAVDRFLELERSFVQPRRQKHQAVLWTWQMTGQAEVLLAQPQTYMNKSGLSLRGLCKDAGLSPEQVLVIHDELDLALGALRFKFSGGLAGHNGLRSIAAELGTRDFYRLRMGIGRPDPGDDVTRHVLTSFAPWEKTQVDQALALAGEGVRLWATQGMQAAMNEVHAR